MAAAVPAECVVCLESCSRGARTPAPCPYCAAVVCRGCWAAHLLAQPRVAACPACSQRLTPAALRGVTTPTFRRGPLAAAYTAAILEHERALLPETQAAAVAAAAARTAADARTAVRAAGEALCVAEVARLASAPSPPATLAELLRTLARSRDACFLRTLAADAVAAAAARRAAVAALASLLTPHGHIDAAALAAATAALAAAAGEVTDVAARVGASTRAVPSGGFELEGAPWLLAGVLAQRAAAADATSLSALAVRVAAAATDAVPTWNASATAAPPTSAPPAGVTPTSAPPAGVMPSATPAARAYAEIGDHRRGGGHGGGRDSGRGGEGGSDSEGGDTDGARHICRCPRAGCRGLVAADSARCVLCGAAVCPACHEARAATAADGGPPHACNAATAATVAAVNAAVAAGETQRCPTCLAAISRVRGCNTMWCVACHTFFDFASGARLARAAHNPEHADWLARRRAARASAAAAAAAPAAAAEGGGCLPPHVVWAGADSAARLARALASAAPSVAGNLLAAHRTLSDAWIALPTAAAVAAAADYTDDSHAALRVRFLLGALSESEWAAELRAAETVRQQTARAANVTALLLEVGCELLSSLLAAPAMVLPSAGAAVAGVASADTAAAAAAAAHARITIAYDTLHALREHANSAWKEAAADCGGRAAALTSAWRWDPPPRAVRRVNPAAAPRVTPRRRPRDTL